MTQYKFIKNKNILEYSAEEPHAFATYTIDSSKYNESIIEEIAIGQSLGAWETTHVSESILKNKVAKVIKYESHENYFEATIAFPYNLWQGNLSWLLTLLFGKMSFYPGIQLSSVEFSKNCNLSGPKNSLEDIRKLLHINSKSPLLMGILKPNVAMSAEKIRDLYVEAAQAGIHLLKDDEIRFDSDENEILKRVALVAKAKQAKNLNTLYAVHLQISGNNYLDLVKKCEQAGADGFLINSWICGLDVLQNIRKTTNLPLFSHPALVGAFGFENAQCTIHPRVTLAQFTRAAGADFSLFPSPYGKLGLPKPIALDIAKQCLNTKNTNFKAMTPVPSAGIKPEHAPLAMEDFGADFVLNAGTGIFSGGKNISENIAEFKKYF
ncbi:MAG: RuBisCO large subunit C-terminal-like domain-containing protein [Bdellovibrionota bacterium]